MTHPTHPRTTDGRAPSQSAGSRTIRRRLWQLAERAHELACWLIWAGHDFDWGDPADDDPVGICRWCQTPNISRMKPL